MKSIYAEESSLPVVAELKKGLEELRKQYKDGTVATFDDAKSGRKS